MKIIRYLLLVIFFTISTPVVQANNNSPLININVLADIAKKDFLNDYYGYLQVDPHFLEDETYVNNLVILCDLDRNFPENGTILLALINQLEKINDAPSRYLLSKLSKLYNLEFHDFICRLDLPKESQSALYKSYYHLNNYSITKKDEEIYPFRVLLTKTIISFFVIHYSQANFNQKKASWILSLEKLRKKMHKLNNTLAENKVSPDIINNFSDIIEAYSLTEPLVQPKKAQRLILQSLIIITIAAVTIYGIKKLLDQDLWIDQNDPSHTRHINGHAYVKNALKGWSQAIMEGAMIPVKAMAHEVVVELGEQGVKIGENISIGLATVPGVPNPAFNPELPESAANPRLIPTPNDPNRVANPSMRMVGEQVILGIATIETQENPAFNNTLPESVENPRRIPVPSDPTRLPNPLMTDMGTMLSAGLATVQGIPNPAFNPDLPESAGNPRLIPTPNDPTRLPNPNMTELGELLSLGLATVKGVPNPTFNAALPESKTNPRLIPPQGDPTRIPNPSIIQAGELMGDGLVTALIETTSPQPIAPANDVENAEEAPVEPQVNAVEQVGANLARGALNEVRDRNTAATRNLVGAPPGQEGWWRGLFG